MLMKSCEVQGIPLTYERSDWIIKPATTQTCVNEKAITRQGAG